MLNYYRKFVPGFAIITAPLTKLLKKAQQYIWETKQQTAFDKVISELLKNGTLALLSRDAATALKTVACKIGVASILLQQHEEE